MLTLHQPTKPKPPLKDRPKGERVMMAAEVLKHMSRDGMRRLLNRGKDEFIRNATGVENLGPGFKRDELSDIYDYLLQTTAKH